jgi:hypothetical protein
VSAPYRSKGQLRTLALREKGAREYRETLERLGLSFEAWDNEPDPHPLAGLPAHRTQENLHHGRG